MNLSKKYILYSDNLYIYAKNPSVELVSVNLQDFRVSTYNNVIINRKFLQNWSISLKNYSLGLNVQVLIFIPNTDNLCSMDKKQQYLFFFSAEEYIARRRVASNIATTDV